jgi:enediyne biosynthesis protein E4
MPCVAADPFTRINSGPVVTNVNCTGAAWGDFNNDGFIDLFLSPFARASLLFSNNGNGTFSQVLTGSVATDSGNTFGTCWGDYDNDGLLDLFVGVNNAGNDWLYRNIGGGAFAKVASGSIVGSGGNANNCSWADYDNDGFIDLFVANSDQNDFVFHNNGNGSFTRITTNAIALRTGNSQGGGWADYDNDGLADLFVSRINEPNLLYHNAGAGVFTAITNDPIVGEVVVAQGTSWGDYDNNGYLDMFVAQPSSSRKNLLYRNSGDGTFTKVTAGQVANDIGSFSSGCWGDYDNDGFLDLFVANRSGANLLYHNNGDGTFNGVTGSVTGMDSPNSFSAAWGDYDNDGCLDLVVTCAPNAITRLYRNNGNTNSWLTVRCEGRISNRAGIGVKVRALATIAGQSVWQMREISGGQNLGSQDDMRPHFGLGDATNVSVLRAEWPSGIVQEITNVPVRQFITLLEPAVSVAPRFVNTPPGTSVTFTVETTLAGVTYQWVRNGSSIPGQTNDTLTIDPVGGTDGGTYTVVVTDNTNRSVISARSARLVGPVVILKNPQARNIPAGSNAMFSVTAEGNGSLTYQWQRNGLFLDDATNSSIVITNVQLAGEGAYRAMVSNSYGAVFSESALLQVLIRPVVRVQPLSQSIVAGGNVTLTVAVSGNPLPFTYRWRQGAGFITNVTMHSTNCFFVITNLQPSATTNVIRYSVVITNLAGVTLSSFADVLILPDRDSDGLPDEWEERYRFDADTPGTGLRDDDMDGANNSEEYGAGSDPLDDGSRLNLAIAQEPVGVSLEFTAISNRTYTVQFRPLAVNSHWTTLQDLLAAPANAAVRLTDSASEPNRIYRLVTPKAQ